MSGKRRLEEDPLLATWRKCRARSPGGEITEDEVVTEYMEEVEADIHDEAEAEARQAQVVRRLQELVDGAYLREARPSPDPDRPALRILALGSGPVAKAPRKMVQRTSRTSRTNGSPGTPAPATC
jgi:hypothetical protein